MSSTEVEEVFTVESKSNVLDFTVVEVTTFDGRKTTKTVKVLRDTSYAVFTEKNIAESNGTDRRIALIKVGPDFYYPLEKDKAIVYRLDGWTFLLPPGSSTPADQFFVLRLSRDVPEYIRKQFDEILGHFANLVEEVSGAAPEVDAVRTHVGLVTQSDLLGEIRYPSLPSDNEFPSLAPVYYPATAPRTTATDGAPSIPAEPSAMAKNIAKGIVTSTGYIVSGLNTTTNLAENLVHKGGNRFVERETRSEPKPVDPKVLTGLRVARAGADVVAGVSTTVVGAMADGTRRLSEQLTPHIYRHGTKLMSDITGKDHESSSQTMTNIMSVTASGLHGFGTIYNCVAGNAKVLAKAVASETVNYVNKRYGQDAGQATEEAMFAAGNGYVAATCLADLGPKAMVKRTAKEAAKSVVGTYSTVTTTVSTANSSMNGTADIPNSSGNKSL